MHLISVGQILSMAALVSVVSAANGACGSGRYKSGNTCAYCQPGTYQDDNQNPQTSCKAAQAGWYACGPQTVNGAACYGATSQSQCSSGTYTPDSGSSQCISCPPGHKCTQSGQSTAQPCSPGEYVDSSGYSDSACKPCPVGTFNNVAGATGCCPCCAGTFNDQPHQTHCFSCAERTNNAPYSSPGATSVGQCQAQPISGITNAPSCSNTMNGDNKAVCPATTGGGSPNPSAISRRSKIPRCPLGLTMCARYGSLGGMDCVDTNHDPESCGGCVGFGAKGQDCTAIPDVTNVVCERKRCVVKSCISGHRPSMDELRCEHIRSPLLAQRAKQHRVESSNRAL